MARLSAILRQQWFLALLLGAVLLGLVFPAPGLWVASRIGSKPFIFVLLFLTSLGFNTVQLMQGARSPRAILLSLSGTYLILPTLFWVLAGAAWGLKSSLCVGLLVLGSGPTSLASAAIWTRLAGGNAALCVVLIVVSNILNLLIGPFLLWLMLGKVVALDPLRVIADLSCFVLLPILLGQMVRRLSHGVSEGWAKPLGVIARLVLLWVVLQAASKAAEHAGLGWGGGGGVGLPGEPRGISAGSVLLLVGICSASHLLTLLVLDQLGRLWGERGEDRVAIAFVGGQKTLPVALFLMDTYFKPYALGVLSIVVYHALQLILDSILVEYLKPRLIPQAPVESGAGALAAERPA